MSALWPVPEAERGPGRRGGVTTLPGPQPQPGSLPAPRGISWPGFSNSMPVPKRVAKDISMFSAGSVILPGGLP